MGLKESINREYFNWIYDLVCGDRYSRDISYRNLLWCLHHTEFVYTIPKDKNRASDGIGLRRRFTLACGYEDMSRYLYTDSCSVLEMMVALAIRCEENIMDDPRVGDRTGQWFWGMIVNLGLGSMMDDMFDEEFVAETIDRLLDRDYEPDGRGGLFTVRNCDRDLRKVEIWHQLCLYLDSIV